MASVEMVPKDQVQIFLPQAGPPTSRDFLRLLLLTGAVCLSLFLYLGDQFNHLFISPQSLSPLPLSPLPMLQPQYLKQQAEMGP